MLGGFASLEEARALKTIRALKTNKNIAATTSAVLQDLDDLIGALMLADANDSARLQTAKALRHTAISDFVRSFSTRSFLAIYDVDLKSTNVPLDFLAYYNRQIGVKDVD